MFTLTLMLFPLLALVGHLSLSGLKGLGQDAGSPLATSLLTTAVTLVFMVVLGTPTAWLLARRNTPFSRTVEFLMLIPLMMPPLVIGLLLVYVLGPYTLIGKGLTSLHLSGTNSFLAVVAAQIYEATPYYIFAAIAAFSQVDPALEQTSLALGQPPLPTFRRVTLPMALPGLTVGFAMGFARAIGAFGAVIVIAYYPHTLPISIWIALEEQGLPQALPLALLLLLVALPLPLAAILWRGARYAPHRV